MKHLRNIAIPLLLVLTLSLALSGSASAKGRHHSSPRIVVSQHESRHHGVTLTEAGGVSFSIAGSRFPALIPLAVYEALSGPACSGTQNTSAGLEGHFKVHLFAATGCVPGTGIIVVHELSAPFKSFAIAVRVNAP